MRNSSEAKNLGHDAPFDRRVKASLQAVPAEAYEGQEVSERQSLADRVVASGLRRYIVQKYPGSSSEHGLRLGSFKGPLLWMMLGETAQRKQEAVLAHAEAYKTLVETGTFRGDMVAACRGSFERIVSIELSEELHDAARQRFAGAEDVELLHGDSANLLPDVLSDLREPALFWLDAHYSFAGDARGPMITPITQELETILTHPMRHRVLIDDARSFMTRTDYPSIEELTTSARNIRPDIQVGVDGDVITMWSEV